MATCEVPRDRPSEGREGDARRAEARAAFRDQVALVALGIVMKNLEIDIGALDKMDQGGRRVGEIAYRFADGFLAARGDQP